MKTIVIILLGILSYEIAYSQTDTLHIYGPGGPFPPMKELAEIFESKYPVKCTVTKGPAGRWIESAKSDADIIYSGSEFMMAQFMYQLNDLVDGQAVKPVYLRKSGLLVRPGNPKNIHALEDFFAPDVNIMVINGSGLTGIWEDILGQTRDIEKLKMARKNIVYFAKNSAEAKAKWIENKTIDVWITWNIWQIANPSLADFVELADKYTLYRDFGVARTQRGKTSTYAQKFEDFIFSEEAKPVFEKWGWLVE